MVTQIQLGQLFNINGRQVLGGTNSALNTKEIVESLATAKRLPAAKLEDQIKTNESRSKAYGELKALLDRFKDAANFLRNPPGVQNASDNVFRYRKVDVSSNTGVAGTSYFTATAVPGTLLQNYTITNISSLARAAKQESSIFSVANLDTAVVSSTPGAGEFGAGTITVNGQNITLTAGDTLRQVAQKFNAVSANTGVAVSTLQTAVGQYKLIFTATKTGLTSSFDLESAANVTDPSGALDNVSFTTTQTAQNANFEVDGVGVTRESNSVSDVIEGVTLNLLQTTNAAPTTQLELSIRADTEIVKSGVTNFANAYNDLRLFVSKQTELNQNGSLKETAVLGRSSTLRAVVADISTEVSRSVAGIVGGSKSRLSDLGIKFSDFPGDDETPFTRNILTIDEEKLNSAISTDFEGVRKVFEFDLNSDSGNVGVFSRTNSLNVQSFSLSVDRRTSQETGEFSLSAPTDQVVFTTPGAQQIGPGILIVNGASITLNNGDTLQDVADRFNAESATTNITATIVNTAVGKYKLQFLTTDPSAPANTTFNLSSSDTVSQGLDQLANIGLTTPQKGKYQATYTPSGGGGPVTVDLDPVLTSATSLTLRGKANTVLSGLTLVYTGTPVATTNVTITQGIGDRIFNTIEESLTERVGKLAIETQSIEDSNTRLQKEIDRIDAQVNTYRDQLLEKYARLEQALSQINSLLQSLDANDKARNSAG